MRPSLLTCPLPGMLPSLPPCADAGGGWFRLLAGR
jgi:hypothetical protein